MAGATPSSPNGEDICPCPGQRCSGQADLRKCPPIKRASFSARPHGAGSQTRPSCQDSSGRTRPGPALPVFLFLLSSSGLTRILSRKER